MIEDTPTRRSKLSLVLVPIGIATGGTALLLVSNRFGNTDAFGLVLLGVSGWLCGTGVGNQFFGGRLAMLLGFAVAPLAIAFMLMLYWTFLILASALAAVMQ